MKTLIALSLAVLSLTATAADKPESKQLSAIERCKSVESMATTVMKAHQGGVSAMRLYEIVADDNLMNLILDDALESPQYATESNQERTVQEFAKKWATMCMKAQRNGK